MGGVNVVDLTGRRFTRLIVLARAIRKPEHGTKAAWRCRCDCGVESVVTGSNLRGGKVKSCGCLRDDRSRVRHLTHGEARSRTKRTHGSREYRAWCAMITRCYNSKQSTHANYGGRGIRMCDEWRRDYTVFLRDMGRCPAGYSLDRINSNGQYEPANCRWANAREQANNVRTNRRVEFHGQSRTVAEWERALGFRPGTIKRRLLLGWSADRAMTERVR